MTNDRSKATASVSHFTHNGRRTGDPLSPRWTSALPPRPLAACLPAGQLSAAQLSSDFLFVLETKRQEEELLAESSWRREGGGGERSGGGELFLCGPGGRAQRRCTDLHEVITRFI